MVDDVILAVNATGLARVWNNPTGVAFREFKNTRGETVRIKIAYGSLGSGDIMGILRNGKHIEIEIKTGQAVQQDNQVRREWMIKTFRGHYLVARSISDAVAYVQTVATDSNS